MQASVLLTPLARRYSGEVLNSGRTTGTRRIGRSMMEGGQIIQQTCLALDPAGTSKKKRRNRRKFKLNTHCDAGGDVAQVSPYGEDFQPPHLPSLYFPT